MNDDLCFLSATELRARIDRKEVSPVELVSAVLARCLLYTSDAADE